MQKILKRKEKYILYVFLPGQAHEQAVKAYGDS